MDVFSRILKSYQRFGRNFRSNNNPIHVVPYRGYGNERIIFQRGRVLEDKQVGLSNVADTMWKNLHNAWKRFESDEIPGARVRASMNGATREMITDSEGFFEFSLEPELPFTAEKLWHDVQIELLEPQLAGQERVQTGHIMIPPRSAKFGVISDMDDTVLQTNATNLLRMVKNIALGNARTRLPFKGVAAFYQALHEEKDQPTNPLYYVSSSPWNLYDLLMEFFTLQNIPVGPLMLRDWGGSRTTLPYKHRNHKVEAIRHIMDVVDHLPFILIGDSGQQDPEIYHEILSLYPKRILAIYIRNVSRDLKRPAAIRELAKKVIDAGSTLILTDDTLAAAKHAIQQGWIKPDRFPEIMAEKLAEDQATPVVTKVLKTEEAPTVKVEGTENRKSDIDHGMIEKQLKEKSPKA
jgi:phosphatidate phosphatase APP1